MRNPISEAVFLECIRDHSTKKLDLMLGLLINEHNNDFMSLGCTSEWLQVVEHLFFLLDSHGNGFITIDGM